MAETEKIMVIGIEKRICMDVSNTPNLKTATIPEMVYQALSCFLSKA